MRNLLVVPLQRSVPMRCSDWLCRRIKSSPAI